MMTLAPYTSFVQRNGKRVLQAGKSVEVTAGETVSVRMGLVVPGCKCRKEDLPTAVEVGRVSDG
jgi:hypothetical protein